MRKGLLCCYVVGLLAASCVAGDKTGPAHLSATVLKVQKHETDSGYVGSNPTDAPLRAATYTYDVWFRANCVTYVARYESSSDRPLPMFAPNRRVDVSPQKRVLYASGSDGDEMKMSIIGRSAAVPCADR
jgi:hypothetical protein